MDDCDGVGMASIDLALPYFASVFSLDVWATKIVHTWSLDEMISRVFELREPVVRLAGAL